jgi:glycerophosphoryl diester phosphodiesterase
VAPRLCAHRGGPEGQFTPDSLAAIQAAAGLGVDLIEFDVRVGVDGRFVVGHDKDIRADPNAVTLVEVLRAIEGRAMGHVDLKDVGREIEIADVCTEIVGADGFLVTTSDDATVRRLRLARPHLRVGLTLGRHALGVAGMQVPLPVPSEVLPWRRLRRCDANLVAVHHQLARAGVLAGAYRRGLPVLVWTLNTSGQIRRAQCDDRVWAYTTDYPRLAQRLARESGTLG